MCMNTLIPSLGAMVRFDENHSRTIFRIQRNSVNNITCLIFHLQMLRIYNINSKYKFTNLPELLGTLRDIFLKTVDINTPINLLLNYNL